RRWRCRCGAWVVLGGWKMHALGASSCLLLAAPAFADPPKLPAPIAEANQGRMQCFEPNKAAKTCQSFAGYKPSASNGIDNLAIVLISPKPMIVMQIVSPVAVKNGKVCGPVRAGDVDKATFTVGGKPASATQTTQLRQQMKTSMKAMLGRDICTAFLPKDGQLLARGSVDGVDKPEMDQHVIW